MIVVKRICRSCLSYGSSRRGSVRELYEDALVAPMMELILCKVSATFTISAHGSPLYFARRSCDNGSLFIRLTVNVEV